MNGAMNGEELNTYAGLHIGAHGVLGLASSGGIEPFCSARPKLSIGSAEVGDRRKSWKLIIRMCRLSLKYFMACMRRSNAHNPVSPRVGIRDSDRVVHRPLKRWPSEASMAPMAPMSVRCPCNRNKLHELGSCTDHTQHRPQDCANHRDGHCIPAQRK